MITWPDLAGIDPGVIGGLVLEHTESTRERFARDAYLARHGSASIAVTDALRAASEGKRPRSLTTQLPSWLSRELRARLVDTERSPVDDTTFIEVRMLELAGVIDFEVDDAYVLAMLTGLVANWSGDHHHRTFGDPVRWFEADPGLIDRAYWRGYEVEGNGVVSFRATSGLGGTNWRDVTLTMVERGMVPRSRVITSCVEALDRNFVPAASRWFTGLLQALELTPEELSALQPALRRQLGHRAPTTRTAAVRWLREIDQAGSLDDEATAAALGDALVGSTKANAIIALRLLERIRRREPGLDVVSAARVGLGHPDSTVQLAAARLLIAADAADLVIAERDLLEPSVVRQVLPAVDRREPSPPPRPAHPQASVPVSMPARQQSTDDEQVERLARLLESTDAHEAELALQWLALRPDPALYAPLVKRSRSVLAPIDRYVWGFDQVPAQFAHAILVARGEAAQRPHAPDAPMSNFLHARFNEVAAVVAGTARPGGLLATPTTPNGWLDPEAFVNRLATADTVRRHDLLGALLRLAPDGRRAALARWTEIGSGLDTQLRAVVAHALGAPTGPAPTITDPALWVAASRSRAPLDDDPQLISAGLDRAGQGRALVGSIDFRVHVNRLVSRLRPETTTAFADYGISFEHGSIPPKAPLVRRRRPDAVAATDQPTIVYNRVARMHSVQERIESWTTWAATLWPHDAERFATDALHHTMWQRASGSVLTYQLAWDGLRGHPGRFGVIAHTVVALAMSASSVEGRVRAAELFLDLVQRGRASVADVALALQNSVPAAKLIRCADTLQRVADAGRPDLTVNLLTAALPGIPTAQHGSHALVGLLHEEQLRAGGSVHDPALRHYLASFTGTGKAARSARALLAL